MSNVVITGVTGQDGSYMAEYLLENTNHFIVGCTRRTSQTIFSNLSKVINSPRFILEDLDLNDCHSINSIIIKHKPDYFINFGASAFVPDSWNQPAYTINVNTIAIINILEAIRAHKKDCRFYNACSSEIFGKVVESPQNESTRPNPRSIYGVSKNAAKDAVSVYRDSYGMFAVNGILFNHESPRRQEHYVTRKITKGVARISFNIKNGNKFLPLELGNLDARRDWSDARDFVDGVWKMLNQDQPKDLVLSSGTTHSIRELIEIAFNSVGIKGAWNGNGVFEKYLLSHAGDEEAMGEILVQVNEQFYRPAEVDLLMGDSSLARETLCWEPKIPFVDMINEMVCNDLSKLSNLEQQCRTP
jgi:GDPmannose 4,6-dehydratase